MEHTANHVRAMTIGRPHVTKTPRCSLYDAQKFVPYVRHYRRASVVHAAARRARETGQDPLDASKSTIPQRLGAPSSLTRQHSQQNNALSRLRPQEEQRLPAWSPNDGHHQHVVGLALVLLAVDVAYAGPAEAASIRDFYVNVVYNPVILAMVAAGTYWGLEKFGNLLLRRVILPLIIFTALVLLAANYRELADVFDLLWPIVVANPITSTIVVIVALVLLTSPYALVVVVLLGLVYTSQPDAFVLTPKKTITAVETQIQKTVDKQANSLQRAVDNIDAAKDAVSSTAKQASVVTVGTAKQLVKNADQVAKETKKLATDTKKGVENGVRKVKKAVNDAENAANNAARQLKQGVEGTLAAGKRAGEWVQRSGQRLKQAVDLNELEQALKGGPTTTAKPAPPKPADAPKPPPPKPADAPKPAAEAPKPAPPKPAATPTSDKPKPAATPTSDKPKEASAMSDAAVEEERQELLKKLLEAQKKLERARARLNEATAG